MDNVSNKKTDDSSPRSPTPESDSTRASRSKSKSRSKRRRRAKRSSKNSALNPLAIKVQELRRRCEKDIRVVNSRLNNVLTAGYSTVIKRLALSDDVFKVSVGSSFCCAPSCLDRSTFFCNTNTGIATILRPSRDSGDTRRKCSRSQCHRHLRKSNCWFVHNLYVHV